MLGKKRDHIAVFMIFYYMEYVPSKYYVSFMVSTNTSRLISNNSTKNTGLFGSYSNYSALEAVFAALMHRNLNTTTSKSKYMYNNTLLYMSFFAPYFHQGKTCTYFKRYENLKNYNM